MFLKLFFLFILMIFSSSANDSSNVECKINELTGTNKCGKFEVCLQVDIQSSIGQCVCLPNYIRENSECIKNITLADDSSSFFSFNSISNLSVNIIILATLAVVIGIGIFFNNKYRILFNIKEKYFTKKNPDQFAQFDNRERF